jgi:outer membrane protein TolC
MANAGFEAQQKLLQSTSQEVIFNVSRQFLQVLLDKEFVKIAKDNLKTQELLYEQIEAMVEAGNNQDLTFTIRKQKSKIMNCWFYKKKTNSVMINQSWP